MSFAVELRRFARALSSTFTLFPRTNYLAAYPRRTPEQLMEQAWARTAYAMHSAIEGHASRVRNR
jgi:DNA-binding response OmpR family regulator